MMNVLIENLERIHTTEMGVERIRRNLGLFLPFVFGSAYSQIFCATM